MTQLRRTGNITPDVVVLFPVRDDKKGDLTSEVLRLIDKDKIPVITVDRHLDDRKFLRENVKPPFHVASDFHLGGKLAGDMMRTKLGGKGNIAIIAGPQDAEVSQIRLHAFIDEILKKAPGIRIVYSGHTDWSPKEGKDEAENMVDELTKHGIEKVDGIFCCSDVLALAVRQVITDPDVIIIGYDGVPEILDKIREHKIYGTIDVRIEDQAERLAQEIKKIIRGKKKYLRSYHSLELTQPEKLTLNDLVKIEAVIFDFDGLMVENEVIQLESFNQTLIRHGVTLSHNDFLSLVGKTQKEIFGKIRNEFGISESIENLAARKKEKYLKLVKEKLGPRPGLDDLIAWIKDKHLYKAIASSSPKEDVMSVLRIMKLDKEFKSESVMSSFELANGKPNPDIYINTARGLGVRRYRCVVLEDSAIGVRAAKQAGMRCIAVPSIFTRHQDFSEADYVVDDLFGAKKKLEILYDEGK